MEKSPSGSFRKWKEERIQAMTINVDSVIIEHFFCLKETPGKATYYTVEIEYRADPVCISQVASASQVIW